MNYYEQKFWDEYKNELVAPIELLIQNKYDNAVAKLILLGVDNLAGFYVGRTSSGCVGDSFIDFIDKYMPRFNDVKFPNSPSAGIKNRKTGHIITKPSEILYYIFRNDMIHDGSLGIGVEVFRDKDARILWRGEGVQIFMINILGFFEYYKKAIEDYDLDLRDDDDLINKFSDKYNDVADCSFQ